MRLLITGGAGYIGSNTVLKLKEAGHYTVVIDNLSKGYEDLIFSDKFIKADIHNKELIKQIIKEHKIEAILHFAAYIEAGESMEKASKYFNNNSVGILKLLDAMIETDVRYFIFSSTAAVYGYPEKVPVKEDAKLEPVNVYGESKLIGEKLLKWYDEVYGIKYISLRYFNAAGADRKLRAGELHNPETHLIPLAIKTAMGLRDKLYIYGTDYPTRDGTCIRDYIFVEDLAYAHVLALEYLVRNKKSDIFNLGSERGYTVKEVIEKTKEVTGIDFKVEEAPRRPGDPAILIASSEKIKEKLGWKPEVNSLEEMILTAYKWHKKMGFRG